MSIVDITVTEDTLPAIEFTLTGDLQKGGLLRLKASGVAMMSSVEIIGVVAGSGSDATELEAVHVYDRSEMEKNWGWYIRTLSMAVVALPRDLSQGTRIAIESRYRMKQHSSSGGGSERVRYAGLRWTMEALHLDEVRSETGTAVAEPASLAFGPGPAQRLEAYLKPSGDLLVTAFDFYGNPVTPGWRGGAAGHGPASTGNENRRSPRIIGKVAHGRVGVEQEGMAAESNAPPEALDGTPLWFGEFHWHTDVSGDGQRPLVDALTSARDELGLDFAGPADHMGPTGGYGSSGPTEQAETCVTFDEPGRFCTLPGAELSRRYGHANLYCDSFETFKEITSRFKEELAPAWNREPERYDFASLARLCIPGKSIIVPHHPNMDSFVREHVVRDDGRPFWCAMHFPLPADRTFMRLYEVVQSRGAFETELTDDSWRIYDGGLGGSAQTALMRGYRMGFIGGTDNHCGWPTRWGADYSGATAVQSDALDTVSVFDALFRRRCYATSGVRIVADAQLNGRPLGSEILQEPGAERVFRITVRGTAPLSHVQIVHLGYILADFEIEPDSADFDIEWADERPGRPLEDAWYYVRIRQTDGHCAWLSPFWVDLL